ncbi:MAG: FtsW/RodA/SpoVE family cell cycle protein [Anaerovoracaceae bacterium]
MNKFSKKIKSIDINFIILPLCLGIFSLLMISSIAYNGNYVLTKDVIIQSVAYFLGFICLFLIISFDYHRLENFTPILYFGSLFFLLTVYIPGLGISVNGAHSWINLGITTFQPSEIVKITFILIMASYLSKNKGKLNTLKGILSAALYAAPFILVIVKEDLGSGLVFCAIWVFMIFYAGIDYKLFGKFVLVFVLFLPIAYGLMAPYQKRRIDAFLRPEDLTLPGNYQVWNSKVAIGSGGFAGKGLFQGTQKQLDFLPVQKSDFIFSVVVEELGMIGGALLILLFAWLLYRLTRAVYYSQDLYGGLIIVGFIGMFLFQIFENIAMTMGIMPVTGLTLPFISYGGSSVLSNMIALGLVASVSLSPGERCC